MEITREQKVLNLLKQGINTRKELVRKSGLSSPNLYNTIYCLKKKGFKISSVNGKYSLKVPFNLQGRVEKSQKVNVSKEKETCCLNTKNDFTLNYKGLNIQITKDKIIIDDLVICK